METSLAHAKRLLIKALEALENATGDVTPEAVAHVNLAAAQIRVGLATIAVVDYVELHQWDNAE